MKDLEQAGRLLGMAERDYRALRGMEDPQVFFDRDLWVSRPAGSGKGPEGLAVFPGSAFSENP